VELGAAPIRGTPPTAREMLSAAGLSISAVLVVLYFLVNFWSVKVFADTNSAITFSADRAGGDCRGADVFRLPLAELQVGIHGGRHVGSVAAILTASPPAASYSATNGFQSPVNLRASPQPGAQRAHAIFGRSR